MRTLLLLTAILPLLTLQAAPTAAPAPSALAPEETRLKDVVRFRGAETNALMGEGLVVGLAGSGDKSAMTKKMAQRFYKALGSTFDLADFDSKNMAAVLVTAELPPFLAIGDEIDVKVSSTNGASSLKNGTLVSVPLTIPGAGTDVIAVAHGPIQVGDEKAPPGATAPSGHLTIGRVVNGGKIQVPNPGKGEVVRDGKVALLLRNPDFANAERIAAAVNAEFLREAREPLALAGAANRVEVEVPEAYRAQPIGFLSRLMELPVTLLKERARVVVNVRTGVVAASGDIRLSASRLSFGETSQGSLLIPEGYTLSDLMQTLGKFATVNQKIEVLNALKALGALQAELVIQ